MRNEDALFQLGMDLEARYEFEPRSTTHTEETYENHSAETEMEIRNSTAQSGNALDFFIEKDGQVYAGNHIIIDLYDADYLNDQAHIEAAMLECVEKAGATLLHIYLHPFEPTGVSGVAVLAESHISVHTWPEAGYAAFDVFMCGDARPEKCIDILKNAFNAGRIEVSEIRRGVKVAQANR